jgi:hypothetical protein
MLDALAAYRKGDLAGGRRRYDIVRASSAAPATRRASMATHLAAITQCAECPLDTIVAGEWYMVVDQIPFTRRGLREGIIFARGGRRRVGLLVMEVRAFMHSEFKRTRTDPMPVICYSQRHFI